MKLKKILTAVLAASMLPLSTCVYADGLYNKTFDMTNEKPDGENGIVFTQDVPDGDYTVVVTTGGKSETDANIYINGGERVRAYTLEAGKTQDNTQPVVPKDGKIEVRILGKNPNVTEIKIEQLENRTQKGDKPTIYIAGDSTAQTYDYNKVYPQTGWGQVFSECFTDDVVIENRSMGGRSSKSYNDDGRLDRILTEMHPGDYVFIQFGINDGAENKPERYISVPDYKGLLKNKYIGEVEKRGGIPILLTPTAASWWDEENSCFMESRQDYAVPTIETAAETDTLLIDINADITKKWNSMTPDEVFKQYFICEPLESKVYPAGTDDHTHLKYKGAKTIAAAVADRTAELVPELKQYIKTIKFTDIDGHWAKDFILNFGSDILNGTESGRFEPERDVTRAEFLKMVMETLSIPGHAYREGECLDAKNDDWFRFYVQSAADKGIIPIAMLDNCSGQEKGVKVVSEKTEDKEAVTADVNIYKGNEIAFSGNEPITREEMAALTVSCISYYFKNADKAETAPQTTPHETTFTDADHISEAYANYVESAVSYGIIKGMGDGRFCPKATLTRGQAAAIIYAVNAIK